MYGAPKYTLDNLHSSVMSIKMVFYFVFVVDILYVIKVLVTVNPKRDVRSTTIPTL